LAVYDYHRRRPNDANVRYLLDGSCRFYLQDQLETIFQYHLDNLVSMSTDHSPVVVVEDRQLLSQTDHSIGQDSRLHTHRY
jgi:hypothetical protein